MYELVISKQAVKDFNALPKTAVIKVTRAIEALRIDPRPRGCLKLKGKTEYLWRIRVGQYRVIYDIKDKVRIVEIREVGDRKDIYR